MVIPWSRLTARCATAISCAGLATAFLATWLVSSAQTGAAPDSQAVCEWTRVESPSPAFDALHGTTAITPNDAWAVGNSQGFGAGEWPVTLALHWNGREWSRVPTPSPGTADTFFAISAASPQDVWAVGTWDGIVRTKTLIEHWDGSSWSIVPSPNPGIHNNFLHDVAAVGPKDVWVVGASADQSGLGTTLIEHWDGAQWTVIESANVDRSNSISAIDAASPQDIWAVGWSGSSGGAQRPLVQHWDGQEWSIVPSPEVGAGALADVTVIAPNDVWAVGVRSFGSGQTQTLIEHWDGSQWTVVPSPNLSSSINLFNGVAASSRSDIWAVGASGPTQTSDPLIAHWNGAGWSLQEPADVPAADFSFYDVSATGSGQVWAVGGTFTASPISAKTLVQSCARCAPSMPCGKTS